MPSAIAVSRSASRTGSQPALDLPPAAVVYTTFSAGVLAALGGNEAVCALGDPGLPRGPIALVHYPALQVAADLGPIERRKLFILNHGHTGPVSHWLTRGGAYV